MAYAAQTLVYYCSFVIIGMATASFGPAIPDFAKYTGTAGAQVGMLFIYHRLGYVSGSLIVGRLMDKKQGNRFLGILLLFLSGAILSLSFARNLFLLFAGVLLTGLSQGAIEVGGNTGIVKLHGNKAGPFMTGLHLAFGMGAIVSPLIMSVFLKYTESSRPAFLLLAGLAVLTGIFTFKFPDADNVKKASASNFRKAPLLTVCIAASLVFAVAGQLGFTGWVYSYALRTGLEAEAMAGILTAVYWAALTSGRLCGIAAMSRMGTDRILFITTAGAVVSALILLLFPEIRSALWLTTILLGLTQASVLPAALTFAGEQRILSGFAAGIFTASTSLGGMIFPPLIGKLMQSAGTFAFPSVVSATQFLAFVFIFIIMRVKSRRSIS